MLVEKFRETISKNTKLLRECFLIQNEYPKIFVFGRHTNSTIKIKLHQKNFKKFLKKVEFPTIPIKFEVEYIGYGVVGYITDVSEDGKNYTVNYAFFGAKRAIMYKSNFKEMKPGDTFSIEYIANANGSFNFALEYTDVNSSNVNLLTTFLSLISFTNLSA